MTASGSALVFLDDQPENPYFKLVPDQTIAIIPSFTLECGSTLEKVAVAYKTWGKLNPTGTNAMVVCHALSGSSDVEDWWGPLIGPGRAFDTTRYFIFCANMLGSPYGSASPVTHNPYIRGDPTDSDNVYGPEFPLTTIRDDVKIQRLLLDSLHVKSVAAVIGGSMGGMAVLEYAVSFPDFVRSFIPLATSARHSAWCISWGETQRQSIYSDPEYRDGYYYLKEYQKAGCKGPQTGLAAARMSALLTYRSRNSFESRFGRKIGKVQASGADSSSASGSEADLSPAERALRLHNEGHRSKGSPARRISNGSPTLAIDANRIERSGVDGAETLDFRERKETLTGAIPQKEAEAEARKEVRAITESLTNPNGTQVRPARGPLAVHRPPSGASALLPTSTLFSAQTYLRYQGNKFVNRFDANCYIHITRKLDTHDIARARLPPEDDMLQSADEFTQTGYILKKVQQPALIIGVESDGLFTIGEQIHIAQNLPHCELVVIQSPDGHDGFLLEFAQISDVIQSFLRKTLPEIYDGEPLELPRNASPTRMMKDSVFGEAEVEDVTRW